MTQDPLARFMEVAPWPSEDDGERPWRGVRPVEDVVVVDDLL